MKEKGITLIALVVTIIILLILAGVTLNIALSDGGLFSKTQEAADKYQQTQSDEETMVSQIATQMYSEYVGAEITGYIPIETTCKIDAKTSGYDNDQDFETESLAWRIWDFDGNTLRIIGDATNNTLILYGAAGYNNGVWAMDHICKELYTNGKNEVKVTTFKRSDIQKVSTYDFAQYKHIPSSEIETPSESANNTLQFGESKSYEVSFKYPKMWETNDQKWKYEWKDNQGVTEIDKYCSIWEDTGNGDIEGYLESNSSPSNLKQTIISHDFEQNEFIKDSYYNLIFNNVNGKQMNATWLGTRYVGTWQDYCSFGLSWCGEYNGKMHIGGNMRFNNKR